MKGLEYGQEQRHSDGEEGEKEVEGQACEVFVAANWLAEGAGGGAPLFLIRLSLLLLLSSTEYCVFSQCQFPHTIIILQSMSITLSC